MEDRRRKGQMDSETGEISRLSSKMSYLKSSVFRLLSSQILNQVFQLTGMIFCINFFDDAQHRAVGIYHKC